MSKKIKKLIKRYRHNLKWPLVVTSGPEVKTLMITTDHLNRHHNIHMPEYDVRPMEHLHEIGHAFLAENVNPMFSTQYFATGIEESIVNEIAPAGQAASDWFVDHWLFEIAPKEALYEIRDHFEMVINRIQSNQSGSPDIFTGACLIIAQAEKYCGEKIDLGGSLESGVDALRVVNPQSPSVGKLELIINGLLACYSSLRVQHIVDDQCLDRWALKTEEDKL